MEALDVDALPFVFPDLQVRLFFNITVEQVEKPLVVDLDERAVDVDLEVFIRDLGKNVDETAGDETSIIRARNCSQLAISVHRKGGCFLDGSLILVIFPGRFRSLLGFLPLVQLNVRISVDIDWVVLTSLYSFKISKVLGV